MLPVISQTATNQHTIRPIKNKILLNLGLLALLAVHGNKHNSISNLENKNFLKKSSVNLYINTQNTGTDRYNKLVKKDVLCYVSVQMQLPPSTRQDLCWKLTFQLTASTWIEHVSRLFFPVLALIFYKIVQWRVWGVCIELHICSMAYFT